MGSPVSIIVLQNLKSCLFKTFHYLCRSGQCWKAITNFNTLKRRLGGRIFSLEYTICSYITITVATIQSYWVGLDWIGLDGHIPPSMLHDEGYLHRMCQAHTIRLQQTLHHPLVLVQPLGKPDNARSRECSRTQDRVTIKAATTGLL